MDYKETLLMPKTEFQMKGNLPENEVLQIKKWDEEHLYDKIREKNKGRKPFVLHDGPPYANGSIHIGHDAVPDIKKYNDYKEILSEKDTPTGSSGGKTNENAVLPGKGNKKTYYLGPNGEVVHSEYKRLLIRKKK